MGEDRLGHGLPHGLREEHAVLVQSAALILSSKTTFFVGKNGTGKSTLLETTDLFIRDRQRPLDWLHAK